VYELTAAALTCEESSVDACSKSMCNPMDGSCMTATRTCEVLYLHISSCSLVATVLYMSCCSHFKDGMLSRAWPLCSTFLLLHTPLLIPPPSPHSQDKCLCTKDSCVAGQGCTNVPDHVACERHFLNLGIDLPDCWFPRCSPELFPPTEKDQTCCGRVGWDSICNDNDPCTEDSCVDNKCQNIEIDCNDGNPCTLDSCVRGQCSHVVDDAVFFEGDKLCDDSLACTKDYCDLVSGSC
jgi:slime mold repeat-containing protein